MSESYNLQSNTEINPRKKKFKSIKFNKRKAISVLSLILILGGAGITLALVKQNQDNRNYANGNDIPKNLMVNKSKTPEYKKGEIIVKFTSGIDSNTQASSGLSAASLKSTRTAQKKVDNSKVNSLAELNNKYPIKSVQSTFVGIRPTRSSIQSAGGLSLKEEADSGSGVYRIEFQDKNLNPYAVVKDLRDEPSVVYAEPNYIYYDQNYTDPYYLDSYPNSVSSRDPIWNPNYDYQWNLKLINAEVANNSVTTRRSPITVAVIDTGVDYTHPEFGACNLDQVNANNCPNIAPGFNFVGDPSVESLDPMDRFGHGTHVAGIISALNNNIGVAGVVNGARIMPIKGLDDNGSGTMEDLAQSIYYAVDNGAKVINASWGGAGDSVTLTDAIKYANSKGVVFVAAAGNSNIDVKYFSPANITCSDRNNPNVDCVLTVASLSPFQSKSRFSNYGSGIDVSAPGEEILSLKSGSIVDYFNDYIVGKNYLRLSGTSMAAPHVAALAALILQKNPNLSASQVRNIILNGTDDYGTPYFDSTFGFGKINMEKSIKNMDTNDQPIAKISSPIAYTKMGNKFKIYGSASGNQFSSYKIGILDDKTNPGGNTSGVKLESDGKKPVVEGLLANIDLSSYPEGVYSFLLTTYATDGRSVTSETNVYLDKSIRDGFPLAFNSDAALYPPLITDLNNDGKKEISYQSTSKGLLYLMDNNGNNMPGWPKSTGITPTGVSEFIDFDNTPIAVDFDPNFPGKEIIFPVSNRSLYRLELLAFHSDGTPVAGWTRSDWDKRPLMGHIGYSSNAITASRIGGKVVVSLAESFPGGGYFVPWNTPYKAYLFDSKGNSMPGWPVNLSLITMESGHSYRSPIIADLDNNGTSEISVLEDSKRIYVFSAEGKLIRKIDPGFQENEYGVNWLLTDFDSNGKKEFVLASNRLAGEYPNLSNTNKIYILNSDGSKYSDKWPLTYTFDTDRYLTPAISVGDFNNDKKPEIAIYVKNQLHILDSNASDLPGSPFTDPTSSYYPVLTNVSNSDGSSMISVTDPSYYLDQVKLLSYSKAGFNYVNRYPKSFYNEYSFGFTSGEPSLVDLDNDGKIDFTVPVNANTGLGFLFNIDSYLYSFNTDIPMNKGGWSQFLKDDIHSNAYLDNSPLAYKTMNLNPSADAFVRSSDPNKNFGDGGWLQTDSNPDEIAYMKFNLSSLGGKTIKSAQLVLTVNEPTGATLNLKRGEDKDWGENSITYSNRPQLVAVITSFNAKTANSKITLDVKNAVNSKKGDKVTFGIKSLGNDAATFFSTRSSSAARRPKLIIEYE